MHPVNRLRRSWWTFRMGAHYKHPLCCTLRYTFCRHACPGITHGGSWTDRAGYFVPCGLFHTPNDSAHDPAHPDFGALRGPILGSPRHPWYETVALCEWLDLYLGVEDGFY